MQQRGGNKPVFTTLPWAVRRTMLRIAWDEYRDPVMVGKALQGLLRLAQNLRGTSGYAKWVKCGDRYFRNINSGALPSLALDSFIRHELRMLKPDGTPSRHLQSVIFSITSRCPLKCAHCYEWDQLSTREKLSRDDLHGILEQLLANGISNIQFSGGEPLARFDVLTELIRRASVVADTWILTSGWGLTREKAQALRDAGLSGVAVSVDHYLEAEHNRFRGSDMAWTWAMDAIQNARQAGMMTAMSLCVTREFARFNHLRSYLNMARGLGVGIVRILDARQAGHYKDMDIELDEVAIRELEAFYVCYECAPPSSGYPILDYVGYYQRRIGCFGGGNRYLYIDSNADVHACPFCQGAAGNALREGLEHCVLRLREVGCHKYDVAGGNGELS